MTSFAFLKRNTGMLLCVIPVQAWDQGTCAENPALPTAQQNANDWSALGLLTSESQADARPECSQCFMWSAQPNIRRKTKDNRYCLCLIQAIVMQSADLLYLT